MISKTRNVQGGISCGYYKRRTSLNDLVVHENITFREECFLLSCCFVPEGNVFISNACYFFKRYDNKD